MNDIPLIERLIKFLESSEVESIEITKGWFTTTVRVSKAGRAGSSSGHVIVESPAAAAPASVSAPAPAPTPTAEATSQEPVTSLVDITSPMVGTFYRAPEPGAEPYLDEGSRVKSSDVVCIIEAMKIMNEINADVSGVVREVCVENAQAVEFGQVLFRVDPNG